jgi:hypothetical protein
MRRAMKFTVVSSNELALGDGGIEAYCGRQQLRHGRGRLAARQTYRGLHYKGFLGLSSRRTCWHWGPQIVHFLSHTQTSVVFPMLMAAK